MIVPEHIAAIQPYIPGKPIDELERELGIEHSVKLASNENPLGPSPKALNAATEAFSTVNRYPDGGGYHLKNALAVKWGVRPEEIILGNGSNELIEMAVRTYLMPGDEAIMATPSFVVYDSAVRAAGGISCNVPLKDGRHDLPAMADRLTSKTRLVFIANPNNPTGTIVSQAEVSLLLERLPDNCLLIMDEAYLEYVTYPDFPDSMEFLRQGRDMLILRTFSKAYGLAGLRIGYAIGPGRVVEAMNRVRQPFNTNTPAQAAACAALQDHKHLESVLEMNEKGRSYLEDELNRLGQVFLPTQANFIYIKLPDGFLSESIYNSLLRKGVIVRPAGPDAIRVTIGLPEENKRFIKTFEDLLITPQ